MPAYGAAKTKVPELSTAHAHAARSTGTGKENPPRHDVTSRAVISQCRREACAGHITGNGTAPKVVGNAPTLVQDVVLNTPPGASCNAKRDSARVTAS